MIINNVFISYDNQWDTSIHIYIHMYTQQNLIYLFSPCKCTGNGVTVKQWNTMGYNGYCILRIYREIINHPHLATMRVSL